MRVDSHTNYLFVAGCAYGNAYVYDADSGALIMEYQLDSSGMSLINDLVITRDAVYFTDSVQPYLYRLPLLKKGQLPLDPGAATRIELTGDFELGDPSECCAANGIVATANKKKLIIGHSNAAQLYLVDPTSGHADAIELDQPLTGFLDGIVSKGKHLYILTPGFPPDVDSVQVVKLHKSGEFGKYLGKITDPAMDGVASGGIYKNHLYVNNARYLIDFPPTEDDQYWLTKLKIKPLKKVLSS